MIEKADRTIILSDAELKLLIKEGVDEEKLYVVPLLREIPGCNNSFEQRKEERIIFSSYFRFLSFLV